MQKQVIEYAGVPVGIVVPHAEKEFDSAEDVKSAIRDLLNQTPQLRVA